MNPKYLLDLKEFEQILFIGNGGFGEVYKIKHKKRGDILAAKISLTIISKDSGKAYRNLKREVTSLSEFNHPSIVKFIGFSPYNFHGEQKPTIVMEFMPNGSLYDVLKLERRGLCKDSWNDTRKLICIYGIASAMSYIHENNKMHLDLKTGNVLMDEFLCPKLADFGLSKTIHSNEESITQDSSLCIKGTPSYIAPEIWKSMKYTQACDVYSFGILVYEIMTGEDAWKDLSKDEIQSQVVSGKRPEIHSFVPDAYRELIESCWNQNPLQRPTFDEIMCELQENDGFITDLVEKEDFLDYIDYINDYEVTFVKNHIQIDQFIERKSKTFSTIIINPKPESVVRSKSDEKVKQKRFGLFKKSKCKILYPMQEFDNLCSINKKLVEDSAGDKDKEFKIGQLLIEGKENFPQNVEIGLLYLDHSLKNGSQDAAIYYSSLLIDGKVIPQDLKKADKLLKKFKKGNKGSVFFLKGQIKKKQGKYPIAIKNFEKASKYGNAEGMYEYGKMLIKGLGCKKNEKDAMYYFELSRNNGFKKSIKYLDYKLYVKEIADNGGIEEMNNYALMLYNGDQDHGIKIDKREALEYYQKMADKGNTDAMIQCASMLYKGDGVRTNKQEAFKYYKSAANEGDIESIYQTALMLYNGEGVKENKQEAFIYYKTVATKGNIDAMYQCASMLDNGEGIQMNKNEAAKLYKNAADKGNIDAMFRYASMLYNGEGMRMNKNEASKLYKIAADKGNIDAMFRYASMLDYGDGIRQDMDEAIPYYKKAADKKHIKAMLRYSMILYNGEDADIDYEEAKKYFKILAEKGNIEAMAMFSLIVFEIGALKNDRDLAVNYAEISAEEGNQVGMYVYGRMLRGDKKMIEANIDEAALYLRESAKKGNEYAMVICGQMIDHGHASLFNIESSHYYRNAHKILKRNINNGCFDSMYLYGYMLQNGIGVSANNKKAAHYLKIAADKGHTVSMLYYSLLLLNYDCNRKEAARYCKMGADKGDADSMNNYGFMLNHGVGVAVNENEAARYYKMAADRGNIKAMYNYGLMLSRDEGVAVNKKEAARYYKMGADEGDANSMNNYGFMLDHGLGVAVNKKEAARYYKMAADRGIIKAMHNYSLMLSTGEGVAVNKKEAARYFKMAYDKGYSASQYSYKKLSGTSDLMYFPDEIYD